MTTLNSRLKLAFLDRKKGRNLLEKGFTLVELMIVIVIVGVLSAVALPNFLGTRDKAEAGAITGSMAGLAKECANSAILGSVDLVKAAETPAPRGITFAAGAGGTNCEKGGTLTSQTFTAGKISGINCMDKPAAADSTVCTVTITADGVITGAWT